MDTDLNALEMILANCCDQQTQEKTKSKMEIHQPHINVVHTTEMMFRIIHLQVFPQPQHIPLCLMMGPSQNNVPE